MSNFIKVLLNIIKIILLIVSAVFFVIAIFSQELLDILLATFFVVFTVSFLHELGHVIACWVTKTKIVSVKVIFIEIDEKGLHLLDGIHLGGSVKFKSNPKYQNIIYLMGPVSSLIVLLTSVLIYLLTFNNLLILFMVVSVISVILVSLPFKGADIKNINKRGSNYGKES